MAAAAESMVPSSGQGTGRFGPGESLQVDGRARLNRRLRKPRGGSMCIEEALSTCSMALWNGLSQAATVAQLAGVDAGGLITMIVQAVQTVRQNREECQHLMHHVMMIGDLLQMLQQSETMQRPEIRRPLDGLEDTLRQAYMLVMSCQQSNIMYRFLMAGTQAQKFRDIRDRIDSYLRLYPLFSHIDTRELITRLYSSAHPSQPQASEEAPESSGSHANPDSRTHGSASDNHGIEPVGVTAVTDPSVLEEQQTNGYGNAEVLPNRRHRFRWPFHWARREKTTLEYLQRLLGHEQPGGLTAFKLSELATSTNNFSSNNIIGRGGFGNVYKGILPSGVCVAIKTLSQHSTQGLPEFENEIYIISRLQHANIVKLLGCCIEGDNRILVYEYMARGNLHYIIHELRAGVSLAWSIRFRIVEGIVQGACYLHQHSRLRVIHGDLKPQNILLDWDMTPRIGDFGMSVVLSSDEDEDERLVFGTIGYIDPEFKRTNIISIKSDVYVFGINFLEIITAQHARIETPTTSLPLPVYAWDLWSSGRAMELIDASLHDEPQINSILRCIEIALLCVQQNWADRPTMADVLLMLKCETMTLPVPGPPAADTSGPVLSGGSANTSETASSTTYASAEPDD